MAEPPVPERKAQVWRLGARIPSMASWERAQGTSTLLGDEQSPASRIPPPPLTMQGGGSQGRLLRVGTRQGPCIPQDAARQESGGG